MLRSYSCLKLLSFIETAAAACLLFLLPSAAKAADPDWWSTTGTKIWSGSAQNTENWAPVNVGQLKYVAAQAQLYLNERLATVPASMGEAGAGSVINQLINGFGTTNAARKSPDNDAPANVGQVKYVASLFYNRFYEVGFNWQTGLYGAASQKYPWTGTINPENGAPANIGQIKNLFAFTISNDFKTKLANTPQGGLPSFWAALHPGFAGPNTGATADFDGDGLNNLAEYRAGTSPTSWNGDGDVLTDRIELLLGLNPQDGADATADNDGDGITNAVEAMVKYDATRTVPPRSQAWLIPQLFQLDFNSSRDRDGDGVPDDYETIFGLPTVIPEAVYDANEAFSYSESHPTTGGGAAFGPFQAGYYPVNSSTFVTMTAADHTPSSGFVGMTEVQGFQRKVGTVLSFPVVAVNRSPVLPQTLAGNVPIITPGQIFLHPDSVVGNAGDPGGRAVLRFTAPSAGTYSFSATFQALSSYPADSTIVSVHKGVSSEVLHTAKISISAGFSPNQKVTWGGTHVLAGGEPLDFVVARDGNYNGDSTGLTLTCFKLPDPPAAAGDMLYGTNTTDIVHDANQAFRALESSPLPHNHSSSFGPYQAGYYSPQSITFNAMAAGHHTSAQGFHNGYLQGFVYSGGNPASFPVVTVNRSVASLDYFLNDIPLVGPSQIFMQPDNGGRAAVVRFTAPVGGMYSFSAEFEQLSNYYGRNGTIVTIYRNERGAPLLIQGLGKPGSNEPQSTIWKKTYSMAAGETMDFSVGSSSNGSNSNGPIYHHYGDSTGLKLTCTQLRIPVSPPADVVYDANKTFAASEKEQNPAIRQARSFGAFKAGYYPVNTTSFTAFKKDEHMPGSGFYGDSVIQGFQRFKSGSGLFFPIVAVNHSDTAEETVGNVIVGPEQMFLQPDDAGAQAVMRFTAPVPGTYSFSATFQQISSYTGRNGTDISVIRNEAGPGVFNQTLGIPGTGNPQSAVWTATHTLVAGETFDFAVASRKNTSGDYDYFGDSTGLTLKVTRLADGLDTDTDGDGLTDAEEAKTLTWAATPVSYRTPGPPPGIPDFYVKMDEDNNGIPDVLEPRFGLAAVNRVLVNNGQIFRPGPQDTDNDGMQDGQELASGRDPRFPESVNPEDFVPAAAPGEDEDAAWLNAQAPATAWGKNLWSSAQGSAYGNTPMDAFLTGDPAGTDVRFNRGAIFHYRDRSLRPMNSVNEIPIIQLSWRKDQSTYDAEGNVTKVPNSWQPVDSTPQPGFNVDLAARNGIEEALPNFSPFPSTQRSRGALYDVYGKDLTNGEQKIGRVGMLGGTMNLNILLMQTQHYDQLPASHELNKKLKRSYKRWYERVTLSGKVSEILPIYCPIPRASLGKPNAPGTDGKATGHGIGESGGATALAIPCVMHIGANDPLNPNALKVNQVVSEQLNGLTVSTGPNLPGTVELRCRYFPNFEKEKFTYKISFNTTGNVELRPVGAPQAKPFNKGEWIDLLDNGDSGFFRLVATLKGSNATVSYRLLMERKVVEMEMANNQREWPEVEAAVNSVKPRLTPGWVLVSTDEMLYQEVEGASIKLKASGSETSNEPGTRMSIQLTEDTGSRFRKLGINGLPLGDSEPQGETESDQNFGDMHIDALNHNLSHRASDLFVPVAASDLALSAERTLQQEIYNDKNPAGIPNLRPGTHDASIGRPFGACWTSGLTPYVVLEMQGERGGSQPDKATVVDESGASYSFMLGSAPTANTVNSSRTPFFLPLASGPDQTVFMNRLEVTENATSNHNTWRLSLFKRFGTETRYEPMAQTLVETENVNGTTKIKRTRYFYRPVNQGDGTADNWAVRDRYQNKLYYRYDSSIDAEATATALSFQKRLIPTRISDFIHDAASPRYLEIVRANSTVDSTVIKTDKTLLPEMEQNPDFNYFNDAFIGSVKLWKGTSTPTVMQQVNFKYVARGLPQQSTGFPFVYVPLLVKTERVVSLSPLSSVSTHYDYGVEDDPDAGPAPAGGGAAPVYRHLWLSHIIGADSRYVKFNTRFDRSRVRYTGNQLNAGFSLYYEQGKPRPVVGVDGGMYGTGIFGETQTGYFTLPSGVPENEVRLSRFALQSDGKNALDPLLLDNTASPTGKVIAVNTPVNAVVDGDGRLRLHRFRDPDIRENTTLKTLLFPPPANTPSRDLTVNLAWKTMEIDHGLGAKEIYTFNPEAMLALSSAKMITPGQTAGATQDTETTWTYSSPYSIAHAFDVFENLCFLDPVTQLPTTLVRSDPFFAKYYPDPTTESRVVRMPANAPGGIVPLGGPGEVGEGTVITKTFTYWADSEQSNGVTNKYRKPHARTMVKVVTSNGSQSPPVHIHTHITNLDDSGRPAMETDRGGDTELRQVVKTYLGGSSSSRPLLVSESVTDGVRVTVSGAQGQALTTAYGNMDVYGQFQTETIGGTAGTVPEKMVTNTVRNVLGQMVQQYKGTNSALATTFTYRMDGQLSRETKPVPASGHRFPDNNGAQAFTEYFYDTAGRKFRVVAQDGTVTEYEHDLLGRVSATTVAPSATGIDAGMTGGSPGSRKENGYTVTGLLHVSVTGLPLNVEDRTGAHWTHTTYDWLRRTSTRTEADSVTGMISAVGMEYSGSWCGDSLFNSSSFKPTLTKGPAIIGTAPARHEMYYNSLGWKVLDRVQHSANGGTAQTRTAHDILGHTVAVLAPDGIMGDPTLLTTSEIDALGRVTKNSRPDGGITETTYTPAGLATRIKETVKVPAAGGGAAQFQTRVTQTNYDLAGREKEVYPPNPSGAPDSVSSIPSKFTRYNETGAVFRVATPAKLNSGGTAASNWRVQEMTYDARLRLVNVLSGATGSNMDGSINALVEDYTTVRPSSDGAPGFATVGSVPNVSSAVSVSTFYDCMDRATRTLGPDGAETLTVYDFAGRAVRVIGPPTQLPNSTWSPTEDGADTPAPSTVPHPTAVTRRICTATEYDIMGNPIKVSSGIELPIDTAVNLREDSLTLNPGTDGPNRVRNTYDTSGHLLSTERWVGGVHHITESFTYDTAGNKTSVVNGKSESTLMTYDPLGRLLTTTIRARNAGGESKFDTTFNTYNAGVLREVTAPDGRIKTMTYDEGLRIVKIVCSGTESGLQPKDPDQTMAYSSAGELLRVEFAGQPWRNTTYTYDVRGRKTSEISAGKKQVYSYSEFDQLVKVSTDVNGGDEGQSNDDLVVNTVYDILGRVVSITEVAPGTTGKTTKYGYDKMGRVILKELPDGGLREWKRYDLPSGRVMAHWTTRPHLTARQTVSDARLFSDAAGNLVYRRDDRPAVGSIAGMSSTLINAYDGINRLTSEMVWDTVVSDTGVTAAPLEATYWTYDKANNRTQRYNHVRTSAAGVTPRVWNSIQDDYNFEGILDHLAAEIGVTEEDILEPSTDEPADVKARECTVPRIDQIRYMLTRKKNASGIYDIQSALAYRYDQCGNRTRRIEFNSTGQRLSSTLYIWDPSSRLTEARLTTGTGTSAVVSTWKYTYDHRTRRIVRHYQATAAATPAVEIDSYAGGTGITRWTGSIPYPNNYGPDNFVRTAHFIRGSDLGGGGVGGLLYSVAADLSRNYVEYGSRGDVAGISSSDGTPVYRASFRAFGNHIDSGTAPAAAAIRQRASTKEEETTLGLLNEGYRWRDIQAGVFLSRDPAGFVDGPNLYTYVTQNPWSNFDPEGLEKPKISNAEIMEERDAIRKSIPELTARAAAARKIRDNGGRYSLASAKARLADSQLKAANARRAYLTSVLNARFALEGRYGKEFYGTVLRLSEFDEIIENAGADFERDEAYFEPASGYAVSGAKRELMRGVVTAAKVSVEASSLFLPVTGIVNLQTGSVKAVVATRTGENLIDDAARYMNDAPGAAVRGSIIDGAWIQRSLYKELPRLVGKPDTAKFAAALKKGIVGPTGESGIKILREPHRGYTHELKIGGSAQRLAGRVDDNGIIIFEELLRGGLHKKKS